MTRSCGGTWRGDPRCDPGRGNDRDAILSRPRELVTEVMARNDLTTDDVISVMFTATPDLTAEFPALAARKLGFHDVPLICASEIDVPGALPRVVRLMAHVETRPAALRDPARLPARRGGPARGHRPVTSGPVMSLRSHLQGARASGRESVLVVGTGLIGTSIALALREQGVERLAGRPRSGGRPAGASSWARASRLPADGLTGRRRGHRGAAGRGGRHPGSPPASGPGLARFYTDVASVKVLPLSAGRGPRLRHDHATCRATRWRAGSARARGGPRRPVPGPALGAVPGRETSEHAVEPRSPRWSRLCGAEPCGSTRPRTTGPSRSSRTPRTWPPRRWPPGSTAPRPTALDLAGQGVRDVTRIAAGDPACGPRSWPRTPSRSPRCWRRWPPTWPPRRPAMLTDGDPEVGRVTRARPRPAPGRPGFPASTAAAARSSRAVQVVIRDQPGELARLFEAAGGPGSTSRTSGSSTRPGCRWAWPSSRSAPPRPARSGAALARLAPAVTLSHAEAGLGRPAKPSGRTHGRPGGGGRPVLCRVLPVA